MLATFPSVAESWEALKLALTYNENIKCLMTSHVVKYKKPRCELQYDPCRPH